MRFTAMADLLLDTAALAMPLIKPGCRGRGWPSPGRRVPAAWRLDGPFALRALDDLTGVVLLAWEPNPDYDDQFPAPLSDVVR
jgi:hypothetical protein